MERGNRFKCVAVFLEKQIYAVIILLFFLYEATKRQSCGSKSGLILYIILLDLEPQHCFPKNACKHIKIDVNSLDYKRTFGVFVRQI